MAHVMMLQSTFQAEETYQAGLIRLHSRDNVAIASRDLAAGVWLSLEPGRRIRICQAVPGGHKVAVEAIAPGRPVLRYGQPIGLATRAIQPGEHVHSHNLALGNLGRRPADGHERWEAPPGLPAAGHIFLGYRRDDSRVGTRNYVAVVSTVNCSAHVAREIARHFTPERLAAFAHVDGVAAFTHYSGCTFRAGSDDHRLLQRTLAGIARHPNVGGALLVGLGCETNQVAQLVEAGGLCREGGRLIIQEAGGIGPAVEAGIAAVEAMLPRVDAARRIPQPLAGLVVALQCGGSDGWSGVTANPVVGRVADAIVGQGGTVVLAETPEIYGAEHLLLQRAASAEVGEKLLAQVRWWEAYAAHMGLLVDDNRSTGNEAGGLTTIYEKSLGAVIKGGTSPLVEVYDYAEVVMAAGLVFMNTPGYDPVSVTGQVAGGCNLVLFTTGRGSVLGCKPAPVVKVCSNPVTYRRMAGDMDFDAGRMLHGAAPADLAGELLDLVVEVASGQPSKSEAQGVGEAEFCPWSPGAML